MWVVHVSYVLDVLRVGNCTYYSLSLIHKDHSMYFHSQDAPMGRFMANYVSRSHGHTVRRKY